jgi:TPR repeat protein
MQRRKVDFGRHEDKLSLADKRDILIWQRMRESERETLKAAQDLLADQSEEGQKKHPIAFYELAKHYRVGMGVMRDPEIALSYYKKAAEAGHMGACYDLAWIYLVGDKQLGVEKDLDKASQIAALPVYEDNRYDTREYKQQNYDKRFKVLPNTIKMCEERERLTGARNEGLMKK